MVIVVTSSLFVYKDTPIDRKIILQTGTFTNTSISRVSIFVSVKFFSYFSLFFLLGDAR